MYRLLLGGIAGICATMAMTMAMRFLHGMLPADERYPLPPRELVSAFRGRRPDRPTAATLLSHFAFGALAGALFAALPRRVPGLLYGPLVWAASYLGWIPAAGLLKPATEHPARRNLLMLAVHLVWGASLSRSLVELDKASSSIFADGRLKDLPGHPLPRPGDDRP